MKKLEKYSSFSYFIVWPFCGNVRGFDVLVGPLQGTKVQVTQSEDLNADGYANK